ncbi:hypothetical protein HY387_01240 [Candidatus Daviesbacteria bacterium]|nr:hypothetical protein [Candidatus Daviesbacteria bacterium]
MKTLLSILLALFIFALPTISVLAEDSTSTGVTRREAVQQKIATRAAALKLKLQAFRDQNKAKRVEKINETLAMINKKRTDHFVKFLDNAQRISNKLEDRVNEAEASGKDTTVAKAAIADAKTAIQAAKAAVLDQADNDYTIEVSSEKTVREDAKAARDSLRNDLGNLRKQVVEAKQAVAKAIQVAATTLK